MRWRKRLKSILALGVPWDSLEVERQKATAKRSLLVSAKRGLPKYLRVS